VKYDGKSFVMTNTLEVVFNTMAEDSAMVDEGLL